MPKSGFGLSADLLRVLLHLPEDVRITGAEFYERSQTIDLAIEGPSVPDTPRVDLFVHDKWVEIKGRP